jgi:flagellin
MNELAVQASSDIYGDEDRAAIQGEFDQLKAEIDDIASSTDFNKTKLFGSTASGADKKGASKALGNSSLVFQIGADSNSTMALNIEVLDTGHLGIAHAGVGTREAAQNAITSVNNAINTVSARRANLGAAENRLVSLSDRLTTTNENLSAADSRIRDVDMAKEMTEFATASILQQVDTAMLVQANAQPGNVLYLLKSL